MKKFLLLLLTAILLVNIPSAGTAAPVHQFITINLPETVIAEAMRHVLPLSFNGSSSRIEGNITIISITNFRLKNQQILCHLDLMGDNLSLVTRVANQDIRLKLGSARVDFDCDARLRYDRSRQTVYIRPTARDIQSTDISSKADIGQALLLLLNGQEFPISLQNLMPIIAEASDKIISIETNIVDVRAIDGALQLSLTPLITATARQNKAAAHN